MYDNALIYGRDPTQFIVSVEADGDSLVLFMEKDGQVVRDSIPNDYWLITNKYVSSKQEVLEGDQHYKYIAKFSSLEEKNRVRSLLKKKWIDMYDIYDPKEASLVYHGLTYFKGMKPQDVSILSFDIETTTLKHTPEAKVLLISNTFRKNGKKIKKLFAFDEYESEQQMIHAWCSWVRTMDPSILCNHNIYGFDIPYLHFRGGTLPLGRDGSDIKFNSYVSQFRVDGSKDIAYTRCNIYGREICDTMFLAYKYDIGRKYESYALKKIIAHEGLEKKDRQFYDAATIRFNYTKPEEWNKIKAYAIDDADDALALFDLMIPALFYFNQSIPKTLQQMCYSATGSQINAMMVRSYLQQGHSIAKADNAEPFKGAISFGIPGIYKNAFKQDVSSLYPSIMRQYKIYHPQKDPKKHFLEMVEYFTLERLKNKKLGKETGEQYYKDMEQSQKIGINSCYGFLGATGLQYNYPDGAEKITRHGREILSKAIEFATGKDVVHWLHKAGIEV